MARVKHSRVASGELLYSYATTSIGMAALCLFAVVGIVFRAVGVDEGAWQNEDLE